MKLGPLNLSPRLAYAAEREQLGAVPEIANRELPYWQVASLDRSRVRTLSARNVRRKLARMGITPETLEAAERNGGAE